jgi:hypothetical protein
LEPLAPKAVAKMIVDATLPGTAPAGESVASIRLPQLNGIGGSVVWTFLMDFYVFRWPCGTAGVILHAEKEEARPGAPGGEGPAFSLSSRSRGGLRANLNRASQTRIRPTRGNRAGCRGRERKGRGPTGVQRRTPGGGGRAGRRRPDLTTEQKGRTSARRPPRKKPALAIRECESPAAGPKKLTARRSLPRCA